MTRELFDNFITEQDMDDGEAGIKKVFKKMFKRREEDEKKKKKTASMDDIEELILEEDPTDKNGIRFMNLYREDTANLKKIVNIIKKL